MLRLNEIYNGDCLDVMKKIDDGSIDMILTDLPFNVTKNKWDQNEIPLDLLWKEYKRIIKKDGAILLFAQGIFSAKLIMSNQKWYKYDIIWKKGERVSGFLNSKKQFMRNHEQILVFYNKQPYYNPIFTEGNPLHGKGNKYLSKDGINNNYGYYDTKLPETRKGSTKKYPKSVINFEKPHPANHPNEKPVPLLEYLIKTFSKEGEIILDSTCGIGSTCVAAKNINRKFIGIEIDEKWCDMARERLK
jgi:site-specific DNA-methyltransferase (adenine-specific)